MFINFVRFFFIENDKSENKLEDNGEAYGNVVNDSVNLLHIILSCLIMFNNL